MYLHLLLSIYTYRRCRTTALAFVWSYVCGHSYISIVLVGRYLAIWLINAPLRLISSCRLCFSSLRRTESVRWVYQSFFAEKRHLLQLETRYSCEELQRHIIFCGFASTSDSFHIKHHHFHNC